MLTDQPEERFAAGSLLTVEDDGRTLTVESFQPASPGSFARFREVQSRDVAAALVTRFIAVALAAVPSASDPISWDEVIGITVRGAAGEVIGEIVDCYRAGGAEVYLVRTPDGAELDLPAVAAVITAFDPRAGVIVADLSAMELGPHRRPAETARRQRPRRGGARNVPRNIGRDGGAGG